MADSSEMLVGELKALLKRRRIDPDKLAEAQPNRWEQFVADFAQQHPQSFLREKLYLLNKIRRAFPYTPTAEELAASKRSTAPKKAAPKRPVAAPTAEAAPEASTQKAPQPAYKPKVKRPAVKRPPSAKSSDAEQPPEATSEAAPKPAYRPKVRPKVKRPTPKAPDSDPSASDT